MNENRKLRALALAHQNMMEDVRENLITLNFYDVDTADGKLSFNISLGKEQLMCFRNITRENTRIICYKNPCFTTTEKRNRFLESIGIPCGSLVELEINDNGIIVLGRRVCVDNENQYVIIPEKMCLSIFNKVIDVVKPQIMEAL